MNYWYGFMDWPIDPTWRCEVCGERSILIWGMIHGICRCNQCHTQYNMYRSVGEGVRNVTDTPVCTLKSEYKAPAIAGWQKYARPLSEWSDEEWDALLPKGQEKGEGEE